MAELAIKNFNSKPDYIGSQFLKLLSLFLLFSAIAILIQYIF